MVQHASEDMVVDNETHDSPFAGDDSAGDVHALTLALADVEAMVPPLWPLKDYVAVNPFLGFSHHSFLEARQRLCDVRDCDLLPTHDYFRGLFERGEIDLKTIATAHQQCIQEYPKLYADLDIGQIVDWLHESTTSILECERRYCTVAESNDRCQESSWASHIRNDISRHCAAHYDEGQASWPSPWNHLTLYEAWREAAQVGWRMDQLGLTGFRQLATQLPTKATDAIVDSLNQLAIPKTHWRSFLLCELFSIAGWASYVKYRVRGADSASRGEEDLKGLLAIRLAYDVALQRLHNMPARQDLYPLEENLAGDDRTEPLAPPRGVLVRYLLQVAAESAYRRTLCQSIVAQGHLQPPADRKTLQMIFCIDVRSEVIRRHLESLSDAIETFGFAGFFGMALEYLPLGESTGSAQCPVLLTPGFRVQEGLLGADEAAEGSAVRRRQTKRAGRKLWKSFQNSAVSCFSFVESLGLAYFAKLLTDSLRITRPVPTAEADGLPSHEHSHLGPDLHSHGLHALSNQKKTELAENMLRNLGLTNNFARIVAVCGHAADVVNNPYKAGLDCGACGGHSGEPNARVAAALLNDRQVRRGLAERGIAIPDDTWFVPAVHHTTTDEIQFFDTDSLPAAQATEFHYVKDWTREAGLRTRVERSGRLGQCGVRDIPRRSRDWSEVRPEWGLAGNAAFVIAPRSRTAGIDLAGRTFLHSYDHRTDPDLKVLELIMTAPMIVTNWINLQYYASTVDNRAFGSGNKVIHDVVGQFGVLQGNGGDLMTGLPWQSVHDGELFQHKPLRLLVLIEASRDNVQKIVEQHTLVHDLASHGWLTLLVLDQERFFRWTSDGSWEAEAVDFQDATDDLTSARLAVQGAHL